MVTTSTGRNLRPHDASVTSGAASSSRSNVRERSRSPSTPVGQLSDDQLQQMAKACMVADRTDENVVRNWGGSFVCRPMRIFAPETVEQCCALVELARRIGGLECRAIGRSHSPGDIQFTNDWLIRMHRLQGLLAIQSTPKPYITVLAGTFVSSMHTMLESDGPEPLAMINLGSISEQTIGGLIATASHGTGVDLPVLSVAVESMRVVCALGKEVGGTQVVECSRSLNAKLFNATLCGLGATGIIVEVTLNVDHWFKLKQITEEWQFDSVFGPSTNAPHTLVNRSSIQTNDLFATSSPLGTGVGVHEPAKEASSLSDDKLTMSVGRLLAHRPRLVPPCPQRRLPTFHTTTASDIYPIALDRQQKETASEGDGVYDQQGEDEVARIAVRNLHFLANSAQHVRIAWSPHAGMCTLMRINRTLDPVQTPGMLARLYDNLVGYHLLQSMLLFARFRPASLPVVNRLAYRLMHGKAKSRKDASRDERKVLEENLSGDAGNFTTQKVEDFASTQTDMEHFQRGAFRPMSLSSSVERQMSLGFGPLNPHGPIGVLVDAAPQVFNVNCLFRQYTDEWALPFAEAAHAIRAMRDWLQEEERMTDGEPFHFPVEIRFVDADGIWLSPCHGRKTCYIGIVQYRPYNLPVRYHVLFAKFERLMRFFGGRPHWAKAHSCGPSELLRLYPDLPKFLSLRQEVDPDGVFLSPYIRRHLLGDLSAEASSRVFKSRL